MVSKAEAFKKMRRAMLKSYLGKPVPPRLQHKYGKAYQKGEVESIAIATGKKLGFIK